MKRLAPKKHLAELIGEDGERALEILWGIAEGRTTYKRLARDPGADEHINSAAMIPVIEVVPTIKERTDAAKFLYEQLKGKAKQHIDVDRRDMPTRDYRALPDAALAKLAQLLEQAGLPTDDVVEAEFQPVPQLPEHIPMVSTLSAIATDSEPARRLVENAQANYDEFFAANVTPVIETTWASSWGVAGGSP